MPTLPRSFGQIRAAYLNSHNKDWKKVTRAFPCPTERWSRKRIEAIRMRMLKIRREALQRAKSVFPAEVEQFQSLFFKLASAGKACYVPESKLLNPLSKYKKKNQRFLANFLGRQVERYLRAEARLLAVLEKLSNGQRPEKAYIPPERIEERKVSIEQTIFGQAAENEEVSEKSSMWMIMQHLCLQCEALIQFPRFFSITASTETHECLNSLKKFLEVEKSDAKLMSKVMSIQRTLGKDNILSWHLRKQFGDMSLVDAASPTEVTATFG